MERPIQRVYYINSNNKSDDKVTIKVGKTNTIESDSPASVVNSGTDKDIVLDFNIPKGKVIMPTLSIGEVKTGKKLEASITGTSPDFILNLTIPENTK